MNFFRQRKRFRDLNGQEIIALAISSEEDDARIYRDMLKTCAPNTRPVPECSTEWLPKRTSTAPC